MNTPHLKVMLLETISNAIKSISCSFLGFGSLSYDSYIFSSIFCTIRCAGWPPPEKGLRLCLPQADAQTDIEKKSKLLFKKAVLTV